ncbi:ATP-dependent helicase HrpB [Vibrio parahaemolyticus]|uniref:ATP-dependent helicase HrpB n=1 Tax=Vibrio parahaemolyticus TaxID=670 RepID=UPI00044903B3|nr:ATP-dependent helicase HrpB [Vibrio parahaemolyticus]EJG0874045.1 ATP-dependent helicase HrpB [Vibrio parahaemolyticus O3]EJG0902703.1 ATP-dependent helicase HrpB [Vibrio parahaemolyticus O3:K56]EJG1074682.1 ATP-dependent helicase HrpB [Vibrio parahaemolyticus O1:K56]EGQ8273065.1 ATP-dependent helicase HrpB [Vibrio parahaemolyticus]EGQ8940152.1 ATP-dependent helicase HrpB [Vibrio parahaemolyticus]
MSQLPIEAVMPQLLTAVKHQHQVILKAAPGAGKSTYFPLQLIQNQVVTGKVIMLEPRRLAARNIARYLAEQLGEQVGQRVGYRVRGETKVSASTQLEIVTEGVMTRMIQNDPELDGVDLLIFDEFHERSIHADTALALSLEVQEALRDDLKLVVMSATLDQEALQSLLPEACYIESEGRSFAVETRYAPLTANDHLPTVIAKNIESLMNKESGSLLAFLPGVAAIKQVQERLSHLPDDVEVCPLYGQLSFTEQQKAISPAEKGKRKVVLATNIAETSLTIEGIRLVVDSGLERVARFDLKNGLTRLEQTRIAQSSAIQRAGRAGRIEEGICVRLYSESQLKQQPQVPQPEILHSDLASLVMELAFWGTTDIHELKWLDIPSAAALQQAKQLLFSLGLITEQGQLTAEGKLAHDLGVEPRAAAMLIKSQSHSDKMVNVALAAVALIEEPERNVTNIAHSLHRWLSGSHPKKSLLLKRAQSLAHKLDTTFSLREVDEDVLPLVLSLAFPDRIAQQRTNQFGRFALANGHGAECRPDDMLGDCEYLVAIDLMRSHSNSSQIHLACELDVNILQTTFDSLFSTEEVVDWDEKKGRLVAEKQRKLGQLVIERVSLPNPGKEKMTQALLTYVRRQGLSSLNWTPAAESLLERIRCAVDWLPEQAWPMFDEASLLDSLDEWLEPYMTSVASVKDLNKINLVEALNARLGWPLNQHLDEWLPEHYQLPTGTKKRIRYQHGHEPVLSVRMQEVFGESTSPTVAIGRKRLVLELLSPAQRPLQVTSDLAAFWNGSYKDVQKEMKGRYPKHVWPDDPANHVATTKTKRQLNND